MSDRLTRDELLRGAEPVPFLVELAGQPREVLLRPLSVSEAGEVEAKELAGISVSGAGGTAPRRRKVGDAAPRGSGERAMPHFELDVAAVVKGASEANVLAAHYGLVEPAMTVAQLRDVRPADVVTQLGEEVKRISGIGDDAQARILQFRGLAGGSNDAATPPDGDSPGDDSA